MTEHKCGCKGVLDFYTITNDHEELLSFSKNSLYALSIVHDEGAGVWNLNVHLAPGDTQVLIETGTKDQITDRYYRVCEKLGINTTDLTEY